MRNLTHCRVLAGIDERPETKALCGEYGFLANAGDYARVNCPECRRRLVTLDIIKPGPTPSVSGRYGAPMGRANRGAWDGDESLKFSLRLIPLDSGGYDNGGAYWGIGERLYWAGSEDGSVERFFRAANRDRAKEIIRAEFPNARFYR